MRGARSCRSGRRAVAKNRAYGKVRFQSNYLTPIFASKHMTDDADGHRAREDHPRPGTMDLPMYCSEFAWHMLALSERAPSRTSAPPAPRAPRA